MNTYIEREYVAASRGERRDPAPMPIALFWELAVPYAVALEFPDEEADAPYWEIGRELLEEGLSAPAGEGDVRCACVGDHYTITLMGSYAQAGINLYLTLERSEVVEFLADTVFDPAAPEFQMALDEFLEQVFEEAL